MYNSHVSGPHSVTPRADFSSGLSQMSDASVSYQSASLQRCVWCASPCEPELWSCGNIAAQQTVFSSVPSFSSACTAAANAAC